MKGVLVAMASLTWPAYPLLPLRNNLLLSRILPGSKALAPEITSEVSDLGRHGRKGIWETPLRSCYG